jgi:hypothetical protein
MEEHCKMVE